MPNNLSIHAARENDMAEITDILLSSFGHMPVEQAMGNVDTPGGRKAMSERHLQAWREHAKETDVPCGIKCVHTDPTTGKQTIVGFSEWFIYANPSISEHHEQANALISGTWVPAEGGQREKVQTALKPTIDTRRKWLQGRKCAVLMYVCVDPAWRRQGAATMCVQWGVRKCSELGIMAFLEATEEGQHVYKKCGFVEVEKVRCDWDGEVGVFPAMICWPPGTREEDRKPTILSS
ncbi:hypothetical protein LTR91_020713 [Friedmanniomyces endolithicus]|uniref:N-acetyltransferase domain-containing protein n=1 Tax=Friedmanniomyces endolithicus TaxID=329885 RepID=A0AAN6HBZ0_9PEZI|nr:hypothetical protein LTR94_009288 [Friedmanniomyces endolithicus]KAK0797069.1 hypothetical protein LTR59_006914 [Friedmanniomyces endolithicus]KAK0798005.1 hypothetical protein LTR38_007999 [Friedmanniomyces endolithicus]KAK0813674.1 hypothetical protein LTR75_004487 [Friedmanniomyces endolithicus]KAK0850084.1 hypothetical protein LTR03_004798 [Friedmanniomyces endolithicus]